jgi:hypothetical protein
MPGSPGDCFVKIEIEVEEAFDTTQLNRRS